MTNGPYRKPQVVSFDHIEALHKQLSGAVNERFLCQRDMKRAARRAEALRKEATATETPAPMAHQHPLMRMVTKKSQPRPPRSP
jgi:hypothetical protein